MSQIIRLGVVKSVTETVVVYASYQKMELSPDAMAQPPVMVRWEPSAKEGKKLHFSTVLFPDDKKAYLYRQWLPDGGIPAGNRLPDRDVCHLRIAVL